MPLFELISSFANEITALSLLENYKPLSQIGCNVPQCDNPGGYVGMPSPLSLIILYQCSSMAASLIPMSISKSV